MLINTKQTYKLFINHSPKKYKISYFFTNINKNSSAQKSNSNIVGLNFQIYIFFILITIVDT